MSLELNIKPEDIERLVKDSIMQSGFGNAVTAGINKALSGYNNPVDDQIRQYVGRVAAELISEKYAEEVRSAVSRHIEAKITTELIDKVTEAAVLKMERAAMGY